MKKLIYFITVICLGGMETSAFATELNTCTNKGFVNICFFNDLYSDPSAVQHFYCHAGGFVPFVKFTNHSLIMTGCVGGTNYGAGTLTISGLDAAKMLHVYYFSVKDDPGHHGDKYVYIVSSGKVQCHMGTGGRTIEFPGSYG